MTRARILLLTWLLLAVFRGVGEAQTPQPQVTTTHPADGATGVSRDDFVSADVYVPNGGIDFLRPARTAKLSRRKPASPA